MPTAVWTGSLSLGLVVVPVRLYPAIKKKAVRFHEIDSGGRRVRHVRVSEPDLQYPPLDGEHQRQPVERMFRVGSDAVGLPLRTDEGERGSNAFDTSPPELDF